ncbi:hypothetical protein PSTG_08472 [Puccinia striiformis f. sp. tritici PST-78]|uniref:TM7S3/TM198-like domain-containing protein n=1 Tax=Puccinia striiformis f. sp. tritici PST-78 TaxID=1165861 RepID=A0A0L0VGR4_9BASI|nr:hypothetical protein PSTG_08472 [Puccinia striiformis f. sp. tritici PST-78]
MSPVTSYSRVVLALLLHFFPLSSLPVPDQPPIFPRQLDPASVDGHEQIPAAADGTSPSRLALSSLLFSIPTLLLGLILLLFGRALPRLFTAFGFAAAFAFPTWALSVNLSGLAGITGRSYSPVSQDIVIWGLVVGAFFLGVTLSLVLGQHGYRLGLYLLSSEAGLALGISIVIFSDNLSIHHYIIRSLFLALCPSIFGLITRICRPSIAISVACASSGAFLLFLGIDLLAQENDGMSRGIRFLFDHNRHHTKDLANYYPPTVTRILLALSWACMLLGGWYQYQFLDRPFDTAWLPALRRKRSESSVQSAVLIDQLDEKREYGEKVQDLGPLLSASSDKEDQSLSPINSENPFPASPEPHPFDSPSDSEQRCTTDSYETGLSAIPEVTEHSTSGRGGSRSGSGSGRLINFPHSHRHPSTTTSTSIRPSALSSELQLPLPALPATSLGAADPSTISVSPPRTVISDTTVFPDDSISQTTRQRLGLVAYSNSGLIEEETEAMLLPAAQGHEREPHNPTTPISHLSSPGSTGLLTRLAHAFGDGSLSTNHLDLQPYHYSGQDPSEEQVLQSDAHRWASLQDRQSPYQHTGRLRRDLHSWTSDQPA